MGPNIDESMTPKPSNDKADYHYYYYYYYYDYYYNYYYYCYYYYYYSPARLNAECA